MSQNQKECQAQPDVLFSFYHYYITSAMCPDCFDEEIESFGTTYQEAREAWGTFNIVLAQRVQDGKLTQIGFRMTMDYVRSEYVWEYFRCRSCEQQWTLFEPFTNNKSVAYTGSFVRYKLRFWDKLLGVLQKLFASKAAT